jgi:hypothetical protein
VDADQQAKQYAIADFDLMWCQRHLIAYIELMTPFEDPDSDPWLNLRSHEFEGNHNFLDILGRSLATSIVISYSRPWSNNRAPSGRLRLPTRIFFEMSQLFQRENPEKRLLPFDHMIHERVLSMRDKIVAHSDHSEWGFEVDQTAVGIDTKLKDPFTYPYARGRTATAREHAISSR